MSKKTVIIILAIGFALVIAFIWGNSVLSPEISGRISEAVGKMLSGILGTGDGSTTVGNISVRKMGHFCEFFALGAVAWLLLKAFVQNKLLRALSVTVLGLFVPLMDETIQIFSGRGHSIRDVWIDISGFAVGVILSLLAYFAVTAIVKRVKNKHK